MSNNSTWPSPDQQNAGQGRQDVRFVYIGDPATQKAVTPATGGGGGGAMTVADGADVTQGSEADAAITNAASSGTRMAFIKGQVKILADMWDSTNHWLQVKVMNGNPNGQATSANSAPIVIASDQIVPSNTKQINGTTTSVNAGNRDAGTQRFIEAGNGTGTVTQVASSATSGAILAANTNKKGTLFYNDSTQILYLLYGTGVVTPTNYSVKIGSQAYFEDPLHYTGGFNGIWAAANGFVYATEVS